MLLRNGHICYTANVLLVVKSMKWANQTEYANYYYTPVLQMFYAIAKLQLLVARSISYLHFEIYWKLFVIFFLQCVNSDGEMGNKIVWKVCSSILEWINGKLIDTRSIFSLLISCHLKRQVFCHTFHIRIGHNNR